MTSKQGLKTRPDQTSPDHPPTPTKVEKNDGEGVEGSGRSRVMFTKDWKSFRAALFNIYQRSRLKGNFIIIIKFAKSFAGASKQNMNFASIEYYRVSFKNVKVLESSLCDSAHVAQDTYTHTSSNLHEYLSIMLSPITITITIMR